MTRYSGLLFKNLNIFANDCMKKKKKYKIKQTFEPINMFYTHTLIKHVQQQQIYTHQQKKNETFYPPPNTHNVKKLNRYLTWVTS